MTREEILAMEAGKPINRLVAEYVMGWFVAPVEKYFQRDSVPRLPALLTCSPSDFPDMLYLENRLFSKSWSPSTSIADAWEVVEKMKGLGYRITIATSYKPETDGWWYARFFKMTDGKNEPGGSDAAPEEELAICRAALIAKLEEK